MAVFSCEAHNDKGLTVSRGVQVNVKGERRAGPRTSGGWGGGGGAWCKLCSQLPCWSSSIPTDSPMTLDKSPTSLAAVFPSVKWE